MQVEIWSDVVCPWCYLGKRNFEQALEEVQFRDQVEVTYRSFQLDPTADSVTPTIDVLATKYGMTRTQAEQAQAQMEERAAAVGLTFRMGDLQSGNTRDAHRLLHLARERGLQDELTEALHRAYFTEQRSVFDVDSLTGIAVDAGLDPDDVARVLGSSEYEAEVAADVELAQSFGISGVPFFAIERRYGLSGAQPPETIAAALERAWDELTSVQSDLNRT